MIRESNEGAGQAEKPFDPSKMLRRMERALSEASPTVERKADKSQQLVYDAWEADLR